MPRSREMDAFELLKQDHRTVEKMMDDIISKCEKGAKCEVKMIEKLREELQLHMRIEEKVFYPKAEKELPDEMDHAVREHKQVKDILKDLILDAEPDDLAAQVEVLQKAVQHHVEEEETKIFPELEKEWDEEKLTQIGQQIMEMKKKETASK